MKTIIASIFAALLISTASFAHVTDNPGKTAAAAFRSGIYPSAESMKLNVAVEKVKGSKVFVRILDAQGQLIYLQQLAKNAEVTHTRFNLSELTDGKYKVEVSDGKTTEVKELNLSTNSPVPTTIRLVTMR